MAYDLRSLSDDDFEAEYHRRLAGKSPSDAAKSIANSAYARVPGSDDTNPSQSQTPKQPDYTLPTQPSVNTAQFIGQSGQIETRPYEPLPPTPIYRGGKQVGELPVIDARAPVKYGGALTGNSLGSEDAFKAKFAPSPELQGLLNQNAASRVGYAPGIQVNPKIVQTDIGDIQNDPFRKAFGGGLPTPTPTPTPAPAPQQMASNTFYENQKKKDQYA